MKKLAALLLFAAALYLFLPLAEPAVKKSPKTLFLENLISAADMQEGRCEADLDLKIPGAFSVNLGSFDGKSTQLKLSLYSIFQKKSSLFAASLKTKPDSSSSGKPLTDLVIGGGRLYLNLHTLFDCLLSTKGEKLNYSLFFPSDYLYFNFQELASLSPETAGVFLISLSIQKCISEPLSPLSKSMNSMLNESLFSASGSSYILSLDNVSFSKFASVLLEDININSQEYAKQLIAAAYPDARNSAPEESREALAGEIKSWSAKAYSTFNSSQDMTASISVTRINGDKNITLSFSISGEKEGLGVVCDMRLYSSANEKISIPDKSMNAEEIFGVSGSAATAF